MSWLHAHEWVALLSSHTELGILGDFAGVVHGVTLACLKGLVFQQGVVLEVIDPVDDTANGLGTAHYPPDKRRKEDATVSDDVSVLSADAVQVVPMHHCTKCLAPQPCMFVSHHLTEGPILAEKENSGH